MRTAFILLALLLPFAPAFGATIWNVVGISDGDSLTVLVDKRPVKIRLANIDAPERGQAFGQRAKESLSDLCWNASVTYTLQGIDRYGRSVAVVNCNGVEVNRAQVERGMAWVYARYNKDANLNDVQKRAKQERRGLWSDPNAVPPWEWRRAKRER